MTDVVSAEIDADPANTDSTLTQRAADAVKHAFTDHPAQTDETYLQHLWFTTFTSLRFIVISILLFLHGLFPFTFTRTASRQIERIYVIMRARIPKSRRTEIDSAYDYDI